jgi:hypothetical protein
MAVPANDTKSVSMVLTDHTRQEPPPSVANVVVVVIVVREAIAP